MRSIGFLPAVMLIVSSAAVPPAHAQNEPGQIEVIGEGNAVAVPDLAYVRVSTTIERPTAEQAIAAGQETTGALLGGLSRLGIAAGDVETDNYGVAPQYGPEGCGYHYGSDQPIVTCVVETYQTVLSIVVRVRDLGQLSDVLPLFARGENELRVNAITLTVANSKPFEDKAYVAALLDARDRAELTASTLGLQLGDIRSVALSSNYGSKPATLADGVEQPYSGEADVVMPIPDLVVRGEMTFSASVEMTWSVTAAQ